MYGYQQQQPQPPQPQSPYHIAGPGFTIPMDDAMNLIRLLQNNKPPKPAQPAAGGQ